MFDPFHIFRTSAAANPAQSQGLHFSYEKAGLVVNNQPIPWNAEAVSVEGVVKVPAVTSDVRAGFALLRPGQPPLAPETLRRTDVTGQARVVFRFAAASKTTVAELRYQNSSLGQLTLPVVSQADYLRTLELGEAIVHVRLGDETCACRSYVTSQAKEMYASALLAAPTNLVPLADLVVAVELVSKNREPIARSEVRLSGTQLAASQALTMTPLRRPRGSGAFGVRWTIAGECRAESAIVGLTPTLFRRSLRLSSTRFLLEDKNGVRPLARFAPTTLDGIDRIGPVFLVTSSAEGMAGTAEFTVRVLDRIGGVLMEMPPQRIVLHDGPAIIAPGTLARGDLGNVFAFELTSGGHRLGLLPLAPVPTASFDGEGGFATPSLEFPWSPSAEEQLHDRLGKLLGEG
ncbi:MAG TPA: hypothetical protein VHR72_14065 [Gemmataceae bacterium]|jgi:hypothetical protein|nr:hypothetical protein [Gemmataceae bacterium]